MKLTLILTLLIFAGIVLLSAPNTVAAVDCNDPVQYEKSPGVCSGLQPSAQKALSTTKIFSPSTITETITKRIGTFISYLLSLVGVLFMGYLVWGANKWINSEGNEENIQEAKKIIYSAVKGLIIVLGAYALTWFILNVVLTPAGLPK